MDIYIYPFSLTHLSVDGHLAYFNLSAIANNAAMNMSL